MRIFWFSLTSCFRILKSFKYMRDWQNRLQQESGQQRFETLDRDRGKPESGGTHLRMASLLCILLSGELFCWLLNFEEMYLGTGAGTGKGKSEIALIRKHSWP